MSMALAGAGATAVILGRPGLAAHLGRGQVRAMEWLYISGASFLGGCVGNQMGIQTFGDAAKAENHWMAYTFVKTQNRYLGGSVLTNAPTY